MGDLADVYEEVRTQVSNLCLGLSDEDVTRPVPATPGWRIRDVLAHLAGDAASISAGDYPREFFEAVEEDSALARLNEWTAGHVAQRAGLSAKQIADEWEALSKTIVDMMRGHTPWPEGVPAIADRVIITDRHDIYGALGIVRDRESPPVRIGAAGYVAFMDLRLRAAGGPGLAIRAGEKSWVVGGDEPAAMLRTDRFELFRALSGRRNPDQIRAYDWDGDPEPYVPLFYLYGVRTDPLVE
ncbi:MAG: maleylpyruvate isomerase N-terminal domain-containing protein [Actinomycetota bacterium]